MEQKRDFVYVKSEKGTRKYQFREYEIISYIPNKPPNYFIKVNNKVIEDQLLINIRGETVEFVPTTKGGAHAFFSRGAEQPELGRTMRL